MNLYLAAIYTNKLNIGGRYYGQMDEREKEHRLGIKHILESYHYVNGESFVRDMRRDGAKVFLDSGAFSAFTLGKEVDLEAYCRYCRDNKDIILHASVLDSVGNAEKTYQNQIAMERLGVKPLPCFHYGEDIEYLKHYVDKYPYITLGGMVPISKPMLKLWLDDLWENYLTDADGRPKVKVHGFGMTTQSLMLRYPWFSVDSSSWVQIGSVGNILMPPWGIMAISENSPKKKDAGGHLDNIKPAEADKIKARIAQEGFDFERLRTSYVSRWIYNCHAYTKLGAGLASVDKRFAAEQITLL